MSISGKKMHNINSTSASQIPSNGIANSATATLTRPRPQPITGTPPPDQTEKFDQKIIQTCNLFGLNLVSVNNDSKCYHFEITQFFKCAFVFGILYYIVLSLENTKEANLTFYVHYYRNNYGLVWFYNIIFN